MKKFNSKIGKVFLIGLLAVVLFNINLNIRQGHFLTLAPRPAFALMGDSDGNVDGSPNSQGAVANPAPAGTEDDTNKPTQDAIAKMFETVAKLSTYVYHIFNPLIHFFTFQIGNFLGNDYIFGGKMGEMLHGLWVIARNIVNVVFALILLVMAFMNVIQPSADSNFGLKKMLPKFVFLLIAVNFSWLGSKVILDAANVATNVVFAIPSGIKPIAEQGIKQCTVKGGISGKDNKDQKGKYEGSCESYKIYKNFSSEAATVIDLNREDCDKEKEKIEKKEGRYANASVFCWKTMDMADYNQNNASLFLSHGVVKVQELGRFAATHEPGASKILVGTIFALILQLVFLIAFMVLWIALVVRICVLWILVAFSPFFVLAFFLKDSGLGVSLPEKLSFNTFMEYAFVPAKVGVVLSVGFVMIAAGQGMSDAFFEREVPNGIGERFIINPENLFAGMTGTQELIWYLMVVIIVWYGTFEAVKDVTVISRFTDKIKDYGNGLGNWVAKVPLWAPIIPLYNEKGGKMHMGGLQEFDILGKARRFQQGFDGGAAASQRLDAASKKLQDDKSLRDKIIQLSNTTSVNDKVTMVGKIDLKREEWEKMDKEGSVERFLTGSGFDSVQAGQIARGVKTYLQQGEHAAEPTHGAPAAAQPAAPHPVTTPAPETVAPAPGGTPAAGHP